MTSIVKDWKGLVIKPTDSINRAIQVIDQGNVQIALVLDGDGVLLGTITDGDIRRGILKSVHLEAPVSEVMAMNSLVGHIDQIPETHRTIMEANLIRQLPIVDSKSRVIQLVVDSSLHGLANRPRENWVILMAGGLGTRLSPLTDDTPKPLLKVGDKPVLEAIIENFVAQGFSCFYISVNYKSDQIKNYFGDGSKWGAKIRYLEEKRRLGTAGSLALIDECPTSPFIVMNGDLVTKVNFQNLIDFHTEQNSKATMCVRDYDFQVPFGVVKAKHTKIISIEEKPKQRFLINAGIYVLDPDVFKTISDGDHLDMPDIFDILIKAGEDTTVFPIREYWLDIGHLEDYDRANSEFADNLKSRSQK
jgi:dTDP-glucose pyrophosphorylase